jgi:hypothetical protein
VPVFAPGREIDGRCCCCLPGVEGGRRSIDSEADATATHPQIGPPAEQMRPPSCLFGHHIILDRWLMALVSFLFNGFLPTRSSFICAYLPSSKAAIVYLWRHTVYLSALRRMEKDEVYFLRSRIDQHLFLLTPKSKNVPLVNDIHLSR